jgi:hypothetical protein
MEQEMRVEALVTSSGALRIVFCGWPALLVAAGPPSLKFNRDVRPILAENCFQCHGVDPNQRKSGLRLDLPEGASRPAESGAIAVVPGKPIESALVSRIEAEDPTERMPPPDSKRQLTREQIETLKRWIAEGAEYEQHWAFLPPSRHAIPATKNVSWPRNPIDWFILSRLEGEGLTPSVEAEPAALFRRLSLDLTGLPPRLEDVDAFAGEMTETEQIDGAGQDSRRMQRDAVYVRWVDKLLASPHYGERMAVDWLDAARFADSNGYQVDRDRENYAWRDWVIKAFNDNLPFDRFTIEQIAGDLLPGATLEQRIATGFHRNHMLNEEGGVIPEEFLMEYCADRVETTATVWLGLTFGCARCHDHKYDPFTQRDFYGMFAFFHNVAESGLGNYGANIRRNAPPMIKLPSPDIEAQIAGLRTDLAAAQKELGAIESTLVAEQPDWEQQLQQGTVTWLASPLDTARVGEQPVPLDPLAGELGLSTVRLPAAAPGERTLAIDARLTGPRTTALRVQFSAIPEADSPAPPADLQLAQVSLVKIQETGPQPIALRAAETAGSISATETAKSLDADQKTQAALSGTATASVLLELDPPVVSEAPLAVRLEFKLASPMPTTAWRVQVDTTTAEANLLVPEPIAALVKKPAAGRTEQEQRELAGFRAAKSAVHRAQSARIAGLTKQIDDRDLQIPTALVMQELPEPRKTHILIRGAYDKKGDEVTADSPEILPAMPPGAARNRLGLAMWLVDPANPLPARVTVNRLWQSLFGTGLVRTSEDFGIRGDPPSHPELLDWLATEFVRTGWDVKGLLRLIVTSATYRQVSRQTAELRQRDPENRLLARGPRFRIQAEFLRDQALAASGLLIEKIGGPSVKPYHPPGIYEQVVAGSSADSYVAGKGDDLRRLSLYTYWKRSVPNPAMLLFDVPFRETCQVRRSRTNTPLQSLNLMNDPTYLEAARLLAERMLREGGQSPRSRVERGFRLLLARAPQPAELAVLTAAYERAAREFKTDPAGAKGLLEIGAVPADAQLDPTEVAAYSIVADILLNLDETVTKE